MISRPALLAPFLLAALCAVSCSQTDSPEVPPGTASVRAAVAPVGAKGQGVLRCSRDGRGCKAVTEGERFDADAQIKTTRGARASIELDDATLVDLEDDASIVIAGGGERALQIDRGQVTVRRARAARPGAPLEIRFVDRVATLDPEQAASLAVRAAAADRATLTVQQGKVSLAGEAGEPTPLRTGDTVEIALGQAPDARAVWTGRAAPVEAAPLAAPPAPDAPLGEEASAVAPPPRGLGTMTARVPGTTEVISGVRLASHRTTVTIQDGFARTEVEEEFRNDTARVLEGRYRFPIPEGASISRLALWVGDTLVEGEVVERKRAAAIFDAIVEDTVRPRDPALLEWVSGGEFSLKIFPIPPRSSRKVLLAYNQALPAAGGRVRYVYPLSLGQDRATAVDDFSITVTATERGARVGDVSTPRYPATIQTEASKVVASYSARSFTPGGDFVVSYQRETEGRPRVSAYVARAGEFALPGAARSGAPAAPEAYAAVRVTLDLPEDAPVPAYAARDRAIVIDRSYSQSAETLAGEIEVALGLLRGLDPGERFVILACDSACSSYPEDGLAAADEAAIDAAEGWLDELAPGGSSDVAGALVAAARRLPAGAGGQLVYLGDGSPSAGELGAATIASRVKPALADRGADLRLFGAGRTVDEVVLRGLARELGATYEKVATGEAIARRVAAIALGLRQPVIVDARVEASEGLHDLHPRVLPNLRLGQEVVLVGKLDASRALGPIKVSGQLGGRPYALAKTPALGDASERGGQNPLVPRLWAEARIGELEAAGGKDAIDETIALSRRFHVMSRATSLLVLESERMFAEFGVERTTRRAGDQSDAHFGHDEAEPRPEGAARPAEDSGVVGMLKGASAAPSASAGPSAGWGKDPSDPLSARGNLWGDSAGGSFGAGGLGLSGIGAGGGGKGEGIGLGSVGVIGKGAGTGTGQGFGSGSGRLGGAHTPRPPQVRMGASNVSGRLPPEVIQRVVRQQFGRLRACYERGLGRNPELRGRIAVRFLIKDDGSVGAAADGGSDLGDPQTVACVVAAFRGLSFPAPEGAVTVVYPIHFAPSDASTVTATAPPATPPPAPAAAAPVAPRPAWVRPSAQLRGWDAPALPTAAHRAADDQWRSEGEKALEKLRAALAEAPLRRARHDALIRGLLARGRFPEALAAARRFAGIDPDLPLARELYAHALAATGDGPGAVAALDSEVETTPSSPSAHARAARAFEAIGDERRACAHWRSIAELRPAADEAQAEALRCRARVLGDREAVLVEAAARAKPGPAVARLIAALEAGGAPAYEAGGAPAGQFEATLRCSAGTEGCPTLVVVSPSGAVLSPWTPAAARSSARSVSFSSLRSGTYRTLVVGAVPAGAELELRALGRTKRIPVTRPGTAAATTVAL